MKKFLSLLMMTLLTFSAWAGKVTIDLTAQGYNNAEEVTTVIGNNVTLTFDGGTNANNSPKYYTTGTAVRMYTGNTLTITATANITEIEFTVSGTYDMTGTFDCGSYSSPIWSCGDATTSTVVYTCGNDQTRIQKIYVTIDDGNPILAAPTVLLNGVEPKSTYTTNELPLTLTIASNNGTENPKMVYTLYSNYENATSGIVSSATLNLGDDPVYGLKVGDNVLHVQEVIGSGASALESPWTTVNFTITEPTSAITSIAEVNALANNTSFTYGGTLTVVGQTGQYLYAQDDTKGALIYGAAGQTYTFGDIIPAGWTGTKTTFKGAPEITNPAGFAAASGNVAPTAIEITPLQCNLENFGRYAVIRGATISGSNIVVGQESIASFNRFGVTAPTEGTVFDIYGVCGYYNTAQFMPLEYVDVTPVSEELTITMTPSAEGTFYKPVTVTISVNKEDALISYKLNGGEEIDYTEPFTLYETTTVSVYAVTADDEAEDEATYTINLPSTLAAVNALADNTEFYFNGEVTVLGQNSTNLYVQDANAGTYIYGSTGQTYQFGDIIPAGWTGQKVTFKGAPEVKNIAGFAAADGNVAPTAIELTPAQVGLDYFIRYAVIRGATFDGTNITVGEESVVIFNRFNVTAPAELEGKIFDIYGIASYYNNDQFLPLEYVDVTPVKNIISYFVPENCQMTVATADGTSIVSGQTEVQQGTTVVITVIPEEDYDVDSVVVTEFVLRADGDNVPVTEGDEEGVYSFEMPANPVSIVVTLREKLNTAITDIEAANNGTVKYVNPTGQVSNRPFEGINIVIDGNKVTKIIK